MSSFVADSNYAMADGDADPTGYGWIRNAYAIDEQGGIYIASQQHMHKVVWTGAKKSGGLVKEFNR